MASDQLIDSTPLSAATALPLHSAEPGDRGRFVKAEVNLLRLPLFSLQTKGLRTLDGIECRGAIVRNNQTHEYVWRVTRHATRPFPGPLSRAVHLALLGILTDRGLPFANPVTFSWRELCRRLGVAPSGRAIQQIRAAIRATHGVLIESVNAVYSKPEGKLIGFDEDDRALYSRVQFTGVRRPDGDVRDANAVWLSNWYLDNLNALYTAPLDHDLWRWLNRRSPIASRLYEYALVNFFRPVPLIRVNYSRLAQSLPVRVERYYSHARKQLDPALHLLRDAGVLKETAWTRRADGGIQLSLRRGARLRSAAGNGTLGNAAGDNVNEAFEVRELRGPGHGPEEQLVAEFYRLWNGAANRRAQPKELALARDLIQQYGGEAVKSVLPNVVERLKQQWPDAKTFGAVRFYVDDAADEQGKQSERSRQEREATLRRATATLKAEEQQSSRKRFEAAWAPAWDQLSETERDAIRRGVLGRMPWLSRAPGLLHHECLKQLAGRSGNLDDRN